MSLYGLLSICFFHKDEGFFFKDIYLTYIDSDSVEIAPIILTLGSNFLSAAVTIAISTALAFVCFRMIMERFMRVSKVQEIIGQDTYQMFAKGDRILKNHLFGIIHEFYPENTGETAIKRQKLMNGGGTNGNVKTKSGRNTDLMTRKEFLSLS